MRDEALLGAEVTDYEGRIENLSLPDPSDRHVLAAAIHVGVDYIVTFNRRDFPAPALGSWDIAATGPDELVSGLFGLSVRKVTIRPLNRVRSMRL